MTHADIYASRTKPAVIAPQFDGIPLAMKNVGRWVLWKLEWRGAWSKVPYSALTHRRASTANAGTWATFAEVAAVANRYDGIGFVLGDGWAGVDLDDCRDAESGKLAPWAKTILRTVNTYAEVSPSGTGVKLFGRGRFNCDQSKFATGSGSVEVYDSARYFCVTGSDGCREVADITDGLDWIRRTFAGSPATTSITRPASVRQSARKAIVPVHVEPADEAAAIAALFERCYGEKISA